MIAIAFLASLLAGAVHGATRPNIVFILVDDQDVMLNSLDAMSKTREIFTENGLHFKNGFSSTPVCCVSRSSILLGRHVHNHLAQNNTVTGNCYSDTWVEQEEPYAYNNYLYKAGYNTMYSGKYLNSYGKGTTTRTYAQIPVGWTEWYTLCGDAKFYSYDLSNNGELESHDEEYETDYFPKLQTEKALSFLEDQDGSKPFLMVLATPAAHKPWTPAPEYEYIIDSEEMTAPRTLSWNYMDNNDKGVVLQSLDEMDDDLIAQSDKIYRMRHSVLLTVDDMIESVYNKIDDMGQLDNTYFIYTADHGFHVGQYGMTFGKRLLYEPDVRVPFYVAGPNVKKGAVTSAIALNVDIAPTIVELALGKDQIPDNMDGRSLVEFFDLSDDEEEELANKKQAFIIEYNGESPPYDMQATDSNLDDIGVMPFGMKMEESKRQLLGKVSKKTSSTRPQNTWIFNCESQVTGLDGMNCDTWNNTYRCVRVIDGLKDDSETSLTSDDTTWETNMASYVKGEVYCSYTCFDEYYQEADCMENSVEAKGEYYDLDYDLWQTMNGMDDLSESIKNEYESLLKSLKACSGQTCRDLRIQESTWATRGQNNNNNNNEELNSDVVKTERHSHSARTMSFESKLLVGAILIVGLALVYMLYTRIMARLSANKDPSYSKVPIRAADDDEGYQSIDGPTQSL